MIFGLRFGPELRVWRSRLPGSGQWGTVARMSRPKSTEAGRQFRSIGFLTVIPFMLGIGPLIGYFAGDWLDNRFGTEPWLMTVFIILGFVAAAREVWILIQKASSDSDKS